MIFCGNLYAVHKDEVVFNPIYSFNKIQLQHRLEMSCYIFLYAKLHV